MYRQPDQWGYQQIPMNGNSYSIGAAGRPPPHIQHALQVNQGPEPMGEGEMPLENPMEASNIFGSAGDGPLTPTAPPPPMEEMHEVPGYHDLLSHTEPIVVPPPPSYQEAIDSRNMENFLLDADMLTEEEAREFLMDYARLHCCWGRDAVKSMWFKSMEQSTAVHYVLKTFLETRSTEWASEPFRDQFVDGPHNGDPPAPWEVQVPSPEMFRDATIYREVPHTASVRSCHNCRGMGRVKCTSCNGWGRNRCFNCQGTGRTELQDRGRARCISCEGSGQRRCARCFGHGKVICSTCDATGQLKWYVNLTVKFKTHLRDFILERTPLPSNLIREVPGKIIFEDTQLLLNPIQSFPVQEVNQQSNSLIQEHRSLGMKGRIWSQSHVIRSVPVFQCDCVYKDRAFQFFVYGDNRRVYCSNYPQSCCCCRCQLL